MSRKCDRLVGTIGKGITVPEKENKYAKKFSKPRPRKTAATMIESVLLT
ncbi:hypothetical protein [Nostoc sp. NMS2]|nr:hypothetical protein [Nostoc sp. NMS2]